MSVCKSRVANVSVQATRDVYFHEQNQRLPIQLNAKIDRIKGVIEKERDGTGSRLYMSTARDRYRTVTV